MINRELIVKVKRAVASNDTTIDHCKLVGDLGFDSLSLMELLTDIEDDLDITIPANQLYKMQTVHDLRQYIYNRQSLN